MSNIAIYRDQFQAAVKEITKAGGHVQKIYHNRIYFRRDNTDYVFTPEMTEGGPMFFKKTLKEFEEAQKQ